MSSILWLGDHRASELSVVGGKVANLSKLARQFRVPDGFSLTTRAFEQALARGGAHPATELRTSADNALRDEISAAYYAMITCHGIPEMSVAVRSSAVDEDGSSASFAGQHETYLNIVGADAIVEAVERCWESARSERALAYRKQQGLSAGQARLAVLVQQLVPADVAAVVFSANPITGSRDEVMINSSWGLGESIVGGTVTPDTFIVRKNDLALADAQIADKRRMTVSMPGGTREVDVPRSMRTQPTLDAVQAAELAQLALSLETMMGWPVDIECAFAGGKLYLLQCRPITTLGAQ